MFSKTIFLLLTVIGIGAALALIIFTPTVEVEERVQAAAAGFTLRGFTDYGMPHWTVVAERGNLKGADWELFTTKFIFYEEDRTRLIATAPLLNLLQDGNLAQLHGGVAMERDDGYRLFAESIEWRTDDNLFFAAQIKIISDEFELITTSFTYNLNYDQFHADGGFTLLLDGFSIVGDIITEREGGLIVMEHVSAIRDDHKIVAPQLLFRTGTREITAEDGVVLSFASGSITADSLRYMLDGGAFTVEGQVRVILQHDFFRGER